MPATDRAAVPDSSPHTMRCLEVWGGNQAVNNGVVMAGLDAWLYSRPYHDHTAGGDIHFVSSCAAGMVTRVLIADVSGHGEAVAAAAEALRSLMRRYVNYVDQSHLVSELNAEFAAISQAGGFATAVVGSYFGPTDEFTLCNAGHPRPLWYRSKSRAWRLMTNAARENAAELSNVPLGIAGPACYDKTTVKLATGDIVILYTDSLIEARDASGKMLGEQGLLEVVRGLDPSDPADFLSALLRAVGHHEESGSGEDDLTVLILRPNGLTPRPTPTLMVKSMLRLAGAGVSSVRPGGEEFPWPETGLLGAIGSLVHRVKRRIRRGGTPSQM
jgi:phosphoserine phosphatase RsbU/P